MRKWGLRGREACPGSLSRCSESPPQSLEAQPADPGGSHSASARDQPLTLTGHRAGDLLETKLAQGLA